MPTEPMIAVRRCLDQVQPRRVQWLVPGLIPRGKLTIVDGDPGQGKSLFTLELAAALSLGQTLSPDGRIPSDAKQRTLLLGAEDEIEDTVRPRLDCLGSDPACIVDLPNLKVGSRPIPWSFPTHDGLLADAVKQEKAVLVVIDPIMAFLAAEYSPNSDQDVRRALAGLQRLAAESSAAVVMVRHLNKSGGQKVVYRGGGSIGLIGLCRSALYIGHNPDEPTEQIVAHVKCNNGPRQSCWAFRFEADGDQRRIVWLGSTDVPLSRLISEPKDALPVEIAADFLEEFLGDNQEHRVAEVVAAALPKGITKKTLENAKRRLKVKARKVGATWVWRLANAPDRSNVFDELLAQYRQTTPEL